MDDVFATFLNRITALPATGTRHILGVAGPPGSGKSTFAETLNDILHGVGIQSAVMPMDGFHYDDGVLHERGLRPRKGSPETFDVAGLHALLKRLRRNTEPEIAVPVFDRNLEISRNAARIIPNRIGLLIVEGNYLLLDRPGWRDLAGLFDLTVLLDVPEDELRRRLLRRWRDLGISEEETTARVEGNDLPNGLTVLRNSCPADITLQPGDLTKNIVSTDKKDRK